MAFSKSFPRTIPGSNFPLWEEVFLTEKEEQEVEEACRKENFRLLDDCLQEAKMIAIKQSLNQEEIVARLAVALFEKKASHIIFWKESKAKEKFEAQALVIQQRKG